MPLRENHVLLLRHCVRSTSKHIKVCDGVNNTERIAALSEFIAAPFPEWNVRSKWCTKRGKEIIFNLGKYIADSITTGSASNNVHVGVNIVSDDMPRNVDTAKALMRGMREVLDAAVKSSSSFSYHGLDDMSIDRMAFGKSASCSHVHPIDRAGQIKERAARFPLTDFIAPDELESVIASLGVFDESVIRLTDNHPSSIFNYSQHHCDGSMSLSMDLMEVVAEMAFYSRASHIQPPFLPFANDEIVYKMKYLKDYIRSMEGLDNKYSARRGLIVAKSILNALSQDENSFHAHPKSNKDWISITIFAGHESNMRQVATALGLRWIVPPPYFNDPSRDQKGQIVSVPPGSGIIFSSFPESDDDNISMSFIVPTNLMSADDANTTIHQKVPIHLLDMSDSELAIVNDEAATISLEELEKRIRTTLVQYPDLRTCYGNTPVDQRLENFETSKSLNTMIAGALIGLVGLVIALCYKSRRKHKYVQLVGQPEVEMNAW
mmetsp:Transcript_34383/g.83162  ORF Transcript_34383/g.83162 Transcript_34383/m.83162 type:complete len:492 (-) Transcript_34383:264-1739(-)